MGATTRWNHGAGVAALGTLVLVLYGRHLGDGYLGDDFLFLAWLEEEGFAGLLRRLTVDSMPRVIRPLPAFAWLLGDLPAGAALHHALSLLLHGTTGVLVARVAERLGAARATAFLSAALFLAFPLHPETVVWPSATPDLLAACFAVAALHVGLGGDDRSPPGAGRLAASAGLFALSLLSKESTLLLPAVAVLLAPRRHRWRLGAALGAVAAVYLGVRLQLFHGLGGYLDPEGRSLVHHFDPLRFLRNACLQLPARLLVPFKRPGELAPLLAVASLAVGAAAAVAGGFHRRPRRVAVALVAALAALLPVAPVLSVDSDHGGSRLLYFPAAVAAIALAAACHPERRRRRALPAALAALLLFWGAATLVNARSWSRASAEVRHTLAAIEELEPGWPAGSSVFVAGHDSWRGAYVWRNGFAFALRRAGVRSDLRWFLGTAALTAHPEELGERVFEIGPDGACTVRDCAIRDWTPCQQALHSSPPAALRELAAVDVRPLPRGSVPGVPGGGRLDLGPLPLAATRWPAVEILPTAEPLRQPAGGRLHWRAGDVAVGATRFQVSDSRRFRLFPRHSRSIVRLPELPEPASELALRLESTRAGDLDRLRTVRIVEMPPACR